MFFLTNISNAITNITSSLTRLHLNSEAAFINLVKKAKGEGKAVIVSGCVPQADSRHKSLQGVSMLGTHQLQNVVTVVEESLKGHTVRLLSQRGPLPDLSLPKVRAPPASPQKPN